MAVHQAEHRHGRMPTRFPLEVPDTGLQSVSKVCATGAGREGHARHPRPEPRGQRHPGVLQLGRGSVHGGPRTVLGPCRACDPLSTGTPPGVLGSRTRRLGCRHVEDRSAQSPGLALGDGALGSVVSPQGPAGGWTKAKGTKRCGTHRLPPARSCGQSHRLPGQGGQGLLGQGRTCGHLGRTRSEGGRRASRWILSGSVCGGPTVAGGVGGRLDAGAGRARGGPAGLPHLKHRPPSPPRGPGFHGAPSPAAPLYHARL